MCVCVDYANNREGGIETDEGEERGAVRGVKVKRRVQTMARK